MCIKALNLSLHCNSIYIYIKYKLLIRPEFFNVLQAKDGAGTLSYMYNAMCKRVGNNCWVTNIRHISEVEGMPESLRDNETVSLPICFNHISAL